MSHSPDHSPASSPPKSLFITGTDTEIGKTHVTCLIARQMIGRGYRIAAYKPACSGATIGAPHSRGGPATATWDDIERLKAVIGPDWPEEIICPQRFLAAVAPPVAARLEGRSVDFDLLVQGSRKFDRVDMLLIEGAGGWLSPLTESASVADLANALGAPVIVVARNGLGTINHTLLTIESIRSRGLEIAGVVLNEPKPSLDDLSTATNAAEICRRGQVRYLGLVPHHCEDQLFVAGHPEHVNWLTLAKELAPKPECGGSDAH